MTIKHILKLSLLLLIFSCNDDSHLSKIEGKRIDINDSIASNQAIEDFICDIEPNYLTKLGQEIITIIQEKLVEKYSAYITIVKSNDNIYGDLKKIKTAVYFGTKELQKYNYRDNRNIDIEL